MVANRWYYLRHLEGFTPDLFECVRSGWMKWKTHVEASIRHWPHVGMRGVPPPDYEWFEPGVSEDRTLVTIPVGGEGTHGSYHLFEETPPGDFHAYLPLWFRKDLEVGRRDTCGWFPETLWTPLVAPHERERYGQVFHRPEGP